MACKHCIDPDGGVILFYRRKARGVVEINFLMESITWDKEL